MKCVMVLLSILILFIVILIESDEVVTPNKETSSLLYVKPPEPDRHKAFINVAITSNQPLSGRFDHRMLYLCMNTLTYNNH